MRDCGDINKSGELMRFALNFYTSECSKLGYTHNHPKYASMLAINGLVLRDIGELHEARDSLRSALRIQHSVQNDLMKAETLCTLSTVLHRLNEHENGREHINEAISTIRSVKEEHPVTATVYSASAQLLLDTGDLDSAKQNMQKALRIHEACCGTSIHPNMAMYHEVLAEIANKRNDSESKEHHLRNALRIYTNLYEREKQESESAKIQLLILLEWEKKIADIKSKLSDM